MLTKNTFRAFYQAMPKSEFEYSIHISERNSYIYVETPKVACSSIKATLQAIEAQTAGLEPPSRDMAAIHNKKLSPLLSPSDVGLERFGEMLNDRRVFKFCFVRNPYTRVLSAFLSKMSWKDGKYRQTIAAILNRAINDEIDFEAFLTALDRQSVYEMDPHWRIQTEQLFWGQVQYDYVGRFENFDRDWQHVLDRIGVPLPQEEVRSEAAPMRGRKTSASDRLKKFYSSDSVLQLVQRIYQRDFETFEYSTELTS
jgi:Sulfotransferase family